jgi:hypothetical protein
MSSRGSENMRVGASGRQTRTDLAALCDALFGMTPLAAQCHLWAVENPRFATFLATYQPKIGKKLRGIGNEAGYFDLLAELEVAYRLLGERSFALVYEPLLAEKQRGPDFAVTFKTHTTFMVEVRHLRASTTDLSLRLVAVFADKLRQLPASTPNVLALSGAPEDITPEHLQQALQNALQVLATPAQRHDEDAARARGFAGARDLLRRLGRLSAVAILEPALLWEHAPAQHPLPPDLRKTLARALGAS